MLLSIMWLFGVWLINTKFIMKSNRLSCIKYTEPVVLLIPQVIKEFQKEFEEWGFILVIIYLREYNLYIIECLI